MDNPFAMWVLKRSNSIRRWFMDAFIAAIGYKVFGWKGIIYVISIYFGVMLLNFMRAVEESTLSEELKSS